MVQGECHVTEAVDAIWLVVDILPVGAEAWSARRVVPIQVRVQLPNDFLVHYGFELPGKEGGPGCLLYSGEKQKQKQNPEFYYQAIGVFFIHPISCKERQDTAVNLLVSNSSLGTL